MYDLLKKENTDGEDFSDKKRLNRNLNSVTGADEVVKYECSYYEL